MKKNNTYLLLVFAQILSCSKKMPETLISLWEVSNESLPAIERTLASAPQGQCLKDIFVVETLRAEIIELEKKFAAGEKVRGKWKHLDLSNLPIPQANFLQTYGSKIGDLKDKDSIDYSSCEDVPCLFNKIYRKDNDVAGYVHYIWYLRFGHLLAADNMVPGQLSDIAGEYDGKTIPLSQYLFSKKELYGLWRLSHMLRSPHTTLSYLNEIQRIPKNESFEKKEFAGACGLADSSGFIILTDVCLKVYEDNVDRGFLYHAVTHELSHQVDYEQGRGTKFFYRSHRQDYLDLAGMFLKEYEEEGQQIRKWEHKPEIKLVSSYGGMSPQENFAETLAYFRVLADEAKQKISDGHYNFVQKNYYQGKSFEKEMLMKSWIQDYSSEIGKSVFKAVVDCSKKSGSENSTYFRSSDFSTPILPDMQNCFSGRAEEIVQAFKVKASIHQPDGCQTLNDSSTKGKWDILMKEHLVQAFDGYLLELQKDKEYLARVQTYFSQLSDKSLAREAFIDCYHESNEELCFQKEISRKALVKAQELKLPPVQTQELAEMYNSYHSYQATQEETLKSYKVLVASHLDNIQKEASQIWKECSLIPQNDDLPPRGSLFQVTDGYMVSSFYNCLNANIPEAIKGVVRDMSVDGIKLQHAKEELILFDEVRPQLLKKLKEIFVTERDKEMKEIKELVVNDRGELRKEILSGFDWMKNVVDTDRILHDCKREASKLIKFDPLFNLKAEILSEYFEKNTCAKINESVEFNNWLETSKEVFKEKVSQGLNEKLTALARARALECIRPNKFPMDTATNKIRYRQQREACLMEEWPKLESEALDQLMTDPIVKKFQISRESLQDKLALGRRRIQLKTMKEFFQ